LNPSIQWKSVSKRSTCLTFVHYPIANEDFDVTTLIKQLVSSCDKTKKRNQKFKNKTKQKQQQQRQVSIKQQQV